MSNDTMCIHFDSIQRNFIDKRGCINNYYCTCFLSSARSDSHTEVLNEDMVCFVWFLSKHGTFPRLYIKGYTLFVLPVIRMMDIAAVNIAFLPKCFQFVKYMLYLYIKWDSNIQLEYIFAIVFISR